MLEFAAHERHRSMRCAQQNAEKVPLIVIPNEVRNPSGFESQGKERFLGTQRAPE
jgi:hypothetical protein